MSRENDNPQSHHSYENASNLSFGAIQWETESLPPVDTPDALNKAAGRIRSLLRRMDHETVAYEDMQRNLHYAARVLEAVFIDESRRGSEEEEAQPGGTKTVAADNQASIESRTKGVSMAPQTHSGPTGPPPTATVTPGGAEETLTKTVPALETVTESALEEHSMETMTKPAAIDTSAPPPPAVTSTTTAMATSTTTTTTATSGSSTGEAVAAESVSSSSSCSNKATVHRQRRLRTPVWARSMSTNKTYLKNGFF
ncbi:GL15269 [Drosophila persimilis]|uniref:GL15269 n=1 Tax=Drosophila persimilis TaxID=7234 RepID=B4GPR7_DROPE|nr:GL15269 [Drosophila persimilis]